MKARIISLIDRVFIHIADGECGQKEHNHLLAGIAAGDFPVKLKQMMCAAIFIGCRLLSAQGGHEAPLPTSLATLLAEAGAKNSQVASAEDAWRASAHVEKLATALPDPVITLQSFSIGSPKPFAGFSNSEFVYVSLGASQELPYPGKLRLRGEVAHREMETQKAGVAVTRSLVAEQVKLLYLQIAYSTSAIAYLDRIDSLLQSVTKDALSQYALGKGSQSAVIKAQMERTQILRQDTMHNQELWQAQARLKQLLHRTQDSPDIYPDPLAATTFAADPQELRNQLRSGNPTLLMDASAVDKQKAQLASAKRSVKPDFNVGYAFQITGDDHRNRYMFSAEIRLPNRRRVEAEIAQAMELETRARHEMDSDVQQKLADLQEQYIAVKSTAELLNEYKEGLIPQAEAVFHSEQSAYQSNKQELGPVLSALLDILTLESDYQQALLDHEAALVRIETLTGRTIR
jgi:cobalt-zinc-cadmium efflux system outer membrane protein